MKKEEQNEGDTMADENTRLLVPPEESVAKRADASAPVLTKAEEMAARIVSVLDRIAERIPDLQSPHPENALRARGARTVSREFVASMISMVDGSPELQIPRTFDCVKARNVLQSRDALRVVSERLAALLARVNYTVEAQWAEVASEALTTYAVANTLAEDPSSNLGPHLKILRRHLRRTGRSKRKKASAPDADEETS